MKKGFTLIELLAVIIILAIVALIATPIILNVIEDARISAGKSEFRMIYDGINRYCATAEMKNELDGSVNICADGVTIEEVQDMVNLGNATVNKVTYDGTKVTELEVESNNHIFRLCANGTFVMDDEVCGETTEDPDVTLSEDSIKNVFLTQYPELETDGNGCVTPSDNNYSYMGGCYLKGDSNNNYIWYSGFLWRIMGINADGTVRMIADETVTEIAYHESNSDWDNSYAKEWLNNYFYNRLKNNDIITSQTWCSSDPGYSSFYGDDYLRTTCDSDSLTAMSKVGLITLDEYNLANSHLSYLEIGTNQWTMTPSGDTSAWRIAGYSYPITSKDLVDSGYGLRPVINVKADAIITGGNGTIGTNWNSTTGPYILIEDKSYDITGKLNENATSGEYVLFAGKKYRVVDKDSNGNTKLILDEYYMVDNNPYRITNYESYISQYPERYHYYIGELPFSIEYGIGQKLNNDVLEWLVPSSNITDRSKLVTNYTWYQNTYINDYKESLDETDSSSAIQATVGLIRVGEMLSDLSGSMATSGYTEPHDGHSLDNFWSMTVNSYSNYYLFHEGGDSAGGSIRPVVVVNSNVEITKGNGTWSNPYEI